MHNMYMYMYMYMYGSHPGCGSSIVFCLLRSMTYESSTTYYVEYSLLYLHCCIYENRERRVRRVPFIGVPREFVRDRARGRRVVQEVPAHGRHAGDFFGHQGRMFLR